jgi:hypothetical protein
MGQNRIVAAIAIRVLAGLYVMVAAPLSLAGVGGASLRDCHGFCLFSR